MAVLAGILLVEIRTEDGGGWSAWADLVTYDNTANVASELHDHLVINNIGITGGGGGFDAEARFTIHTPLACSVITRIDTRDLEADPSEWVEGTESTDVVTPGSPFTVAAGAGDATHVTRINLIGIVWHPWT